LSFSISSGSFREWLTMPVYWKPKYGTRSSRHRAWVKQEARREAALRKASEPSALARLWRRLRGNH
jgi:hypothetical protein